MIVRRTSGRDGPRIRRNARDVNRTAQDDPAGIGNTELPGLAAFTHVPIPPSGRTGERPAKARLLAKPPDNRNAHAVTRLGGSDRPGPFRHVPGHLHFSVARGRSPGEVAGGRPAPPKRERPGPEAFARAPAGHRPLPLDPPNRFMRSAGDRTSPHDISRPSQWPVGGLARTRRGRTRGVFLRAGRTGKTASGSQFPPVGGRCVVRPCPAFASSTCSPRRPVIPFLFFRTCWA
jgi:hypothetical protein